MRSPGNWTPGHASRWTSSATPELFPAGRGLGDERADDGESRVRGAHDSTVAPEDVINNIVTGSFPAGLLEP
jgi:hypothetical protein